MAVKLLSQSVIRFSCRRRFYGVGKRILVVVMLVLSTMGFLLSLVAGIGVWMIKEPVTIRATQIFERVEAALAFVDRGLEQARAAWRWRRSIWTRFAMSKKNWTSGRSQKTRVGRCWPK